MGYGKINGTLKDWIKLTKRKSVEEEDEGGRTFFLWQPTQCFPLWARALGFPKVHLPDFPGKNQSRR